MNDSDVGKIWASVLAGGMKSPEDTEVVKGLIRKLVEERAWGHTFSAAPARCLPLALREFDIEPATWPKD